MESRKSGKNANEKSVQKDFFRKIIKFYFKNSLYEKK